MPPSRRRLPPDALAAGSPRAGAGRLWLLVAGAPVFALAPIVGCAVGGTMRRSALPASSGVAPPSLVAPEVSLGDEATTTAAPAIAPATAPSVAPRSAPAR